MDCSCMTEVDPTDPTGAEKVLTHSLRCYLHPEYEPIYGMCTACGSVEVALDNVTGSRDLSSIGEHHAYPTGYGCELCS